MSTIRTRLYPYRSVSEYEVISLYSKDVTGIAGELVKIVTGAANPQNADGWAIGSNVGAAINNFQAISQRYETKMKVTNTVSGDTIFNALGFTELSTLEFDENGQPLRYNERRAKEIGAVISGETVPIITKGILGIWGIYIDQSVAPIQPGNVVVISRSGNGLIASAVPTQLSTGLGYAGGYNQNSVIGSWLTSLPTAVNTGLANEFASLGGYALFQFNLAA